MHVMTAKDCVMYDFDLIWFDFVMSLSFQAVKLFFSSFTQNLVWFSLQICMLCWEWILSIFFPQIFLNFHILTINHFFFISFRIKYCFIFVIQWSIVQHYSLNFFSHLRESTLMLCHILINNIIMQFSMYIV
jgi:hypothetical protein